MQNIHVVGYGQVIGALVTPVYAFSTKFLRKLLTSRWNGTISLTISDGNKRIVSLNVNSILIWKINNFDTIELIAPFVVVLLVDLVC